MHSWIKSCIPYFNISVYLLKFSCKRFYLIIYKMVVLYVRRAEITRKGKVGVKEEGVMQGKGLSVEKLDIDFLKVREYDFFLFLFTAIFIIKIQFRLETNDSPIDMGAPSSMQYA